MVVGGVFGNVTDQLCDLGVLSDARSLQVD